MIQRHIASTSAAALLVIVACSPETSGVFSETDRDLSCDLTSCDACTTCSTQAGGVCQGAYAAFVAHPDSELYYTCFAGCADATCREGCGATYEQAGSLYSDLSECLHCSACPTTCGDPFGEC